MTHDLDLTTMSQHIGHDSWFYDPDLTMSQHIGHDPRISTIFTTKLFYDPAAIDASLTDAIDVIRVQLKIHSAHAL